MSFLAEMNTGECEEFTTITVARWWAEGFDNTADECVIRDLTLWSPRADHPGRERPIVAIHRRDTGPRWFKVTPTHIIDDGATIDHDPFAARRETDYRRLSIL